MSRRIQITRTRTIAGSSRFKCVAQALARELNQLNPECKAKLDGFNGHWIVRRNKLDKQEEIKLKQALEGATR